MYIYSAYDMELNLPGHFKHLMPYWRLSLYLKHVLENKNGRTFS